MTRAPDSTSNNLASKLAPPAFILFGTATAAVIWKLVCPLSTIGQSNWPEAALLIGAAYAVIAAASRTLPFQNILWGALVIALLGGLSHTVGVLAGIPFGEFAYTPAAGPRILGVLPWSIPLMWIVVIYSSRGMARLILARRRTHPFYGVWMMGITVALATVLDFGLDPFASSVRHYWSWNPNRLSFDWHGTPLAGFFGWTITAGMIVLSVTPMLINKKPVEIPPERGTAWVWIVLNLLFLGSGCIHGQRALVLFASLALAVALGFAGRNRLLP